MAHGNNTNPIPGELRSVASDGVVAAADAIKDYRKNKFQEQVNQDVDTEIEKMKEIDASKGLEFSPNEGDNDNDYTIPDIDTTQRGSH